MPKVLSEDAIAQYHREGYFFPVRILDDEGVAANRRRLEEFESRQGKPVEGAQRSKSHLLFKWVDDLMRDSTLLDAVEDLIGRDILCWNTIFWIKEAGESKFRLLASGPALLGARYQRLGQRVVGAFTGDA